jgi:hypothetical protein
MTDHWLARIEEILWPDGPRQNVWMIVDGARTIDVFRFLLQCHLEYVCLYSGPLTPDLEMAAPYLVQLDHGYRDTHRLIRQAWGNSWGVFLRSDTSLKKLRRHLREFLVVRDTGGNRLVFRYYDPRILRVFLPTCTISELRMVFGPIECFWTEIKNPEHLLEFRFERAKLVQRTISLAAGATRTADRPRPSDEPARISSDRPFGTLTIRQTQMEAFSRVEIRKFEDWMINHLTQFFLAQCMALGNTQLRELIQDGIKRAAGYGITTQRDVCKFIDLMIVFGRDFDTDRRNAWAHEILRRDNDPRSKVRALHDAAIAYLGQ